MLIRPWFYFIFNNQFISHDFSDSFFTSIPQYFACLAYVLLKSFKMYSILNQFFQSLKDFISRKTVNP